MTLEFVFRKFNLTGAFNYVGKDNSYESSQSTCKLIDINQYCRLALKLMDIKRIK